VITIHMTGVATIAEGEDARAELGADRLPAGLGARVHERLINAIQGGREDDAEVLARVLAHLERAQPPIPEWMRRRV
jgi:hypothetical protein